MSTLPTSISAREVRADLLLEVLSTCGLERPSWHRLRALPALQSWTRLSAWLALHDLVRAGRVDATALPGGDLALAIHGGEE